MRVIDLGWQITNGMPVFPGDPVPSVGTVMTIGHDCAAVSLLTLGSHTGTHIDAPAHIIAGGKTLDEFPSERFLGIAQVADVTKCAGRKIEAADIKASVRDVAAVDFILLCTGWSARWGDESYLRGYPVLSEEAALWLAGHDLKGVGVDAPSLDEADSTEYAIHKILLRRELLAIENMRDLERAGDELFCLAALPLSFKNADAAPARVMAILGQAAIFLKN